MQSWFLTFYAKNTETSDFGVQNFLRQILSSQNTGLKTLK